MHSLFSKPKFVNFLVMNSFAKVSTMLSLSVFHGVYGGIWRGQVSFGVIIKKLVKCANYVCWGWTCFTQKCVFHLCLQVAKVLGGLIPLPGEASPNDPRRRELEELEKQKAVIDIKADSLVRRELWGGLAYIVVQTAAFMRLTFWELSWDVMEPICFYVTSIYFMGCYAFFLRTSKEPSFEGFYQSRFHAKQKKLMKVHNFDIHRYNELRSMLSPNSSGLNSSYVAFDQSEMIPIRALE